MRARLISESAIIASLYAVMVWLTSSLSFQTNTIIFPIRLSMGLYPLSTKRKYLIPAFGIGVFIANIISPLGIWDLLFMPIVTIIVGYISHFFSIPFNGLFKYFIVSIIYSLGIACSVSYMLHTLFNLNFFLTFISGLIPGLVITLIFSPLMKRIDDIQGI